MKQITSIQDYCKEINIPPPRHTFFDIRRFEDNMKTVNEKQSPFRHEFYAIALRNEGSNREVMGKPLRSNLFFNSPYQIITWDIKPDWKGWYIIFDREFISMNPAWHNFIAEYSFFRLDRTIPFNLPPQVAEQANQQFNRIFTEYHADDKDKFQFIQAYTQILLLITKRYFEKLTIEEKDLHDNRTADVLLVSRFQTLIETMITNEDAEAEVRQPSWYAEQLSIHPNHLNAVVKRISGKTTTQLIQEQIIAIARSLLL